MAECEILGEQMSMEFLSGLHSLRATSPWHPRTRIVRPSATVVVLPDAFALSSLDGREFGFSGPPSVSISTAVSRGEAGLAAVSWAAGNP
jgi:hypothetical protein